MNETFLTFLSLSLSGAVLICIIYLLTHLFKNGFSKSWQYYIWLLVLARLLLPFSAKDSLVNRVINRERISAAQWQSHMETRMDTIMENADNSWGFGADDAAGSLDGTFLNTEDKGAFLIRLYAAGMEIMGFFPFLWGIGMLLLLVRKITLYQSFVRFVKAGGKEISDIHILEQFSVIKEGLKIRKTVELYTNAAIASPMIVGFFKPYIILPDENYVQADLRYIFEHELLHLKRNDIFYKWLVQFTVCLHWFNPFVYLMQKEVDKSCELSCDECLLKSLKEEEKKNYGEVLLKSVKVDGCKQAVASVTLNEGTKLLRERLVSIMKFKNKPGYIIVISVVLAGLLAAGAYGIGAYAAEKEGLFSYASRDSSRNSFIVRSYYEAPYIIEIGWNVTEKGDLGSQKEMYSHEITGEGGLSMTVLVDEAAEELFDEAKKATASVISRIQDRRKQLPEEGRETGVWPEIEKPILLSITKVPLNKTEQTIEEFYQADELNKFTALFSIMGEEKQRAYLERSYTDNKISFFANEIPEMPDEIKEDYADWALKEGNVSFFSVILDYLESGKINDYAQESYASDNIAAFSILTDYLTEAQKKEWIKKADEDGKSNFLSVLEME